jgi:hypothetical protein
MKYQYCLLQKANGSNNEYKLHHSSYMKYGSNRLILNTCIIKIFSGKINIVA